MPVQPALETQSTVKTSTAVVSAQAILSEISAFFLWWYVEIPGWYVNFLKRLVVVVDDTLSISTLFTTFFVPWHRDNTIMGHAFGIIIRTLYLPIAIIIFCVIIAFAGSLAIFWAILPPMSIIFLFKTPFLL